MIRLQRGIGVRKLFCVFLVSRRSSDALFDRGFFHQWLVLLSHMSRFAKAGLSWQLFLAVSSAQCRQTTLTKDMCETCVACNKAKGGTTFEHTYSMLELVFIFHSYNPTLQHVPLHLAKKWSVKCSPDFCLPSLVKPMNDKKREQNSLKD